MDNRQEAEAVAQARGDRLADAVAQLRTVAERAQFPIDLASAEQARAGRTSLVTQLDDYILPRLAALDAPLLVVVGGSTGSGKSTLVNSVVRESVTRSGVLRPTTRAPVLVHHAEDQEWFTGKVLPRFGRLTGRSDSQGTPDDDMSSVRLVTSETLPAGLALLDAPDIDSVVAANRELSRQLLNAADLWLFVTTAARYADAVPWELLRQAGERGTSVAIVLDRVPDEALVEIRDDLTRMLAEQDLAGAPIFPVRETELTEAGLLPESEVEPLRRWLTTLAQDAVARQTVVRRTLSGALDSLSERVTTLVDASDDQRGAADDLRREATTAYADALEGVEVGVSDGTLLRGEVLARWQEFVGTGEFLRTIESGIGRLRDRLTAAIKGTPQPTEQLGEVLQSGVASLVLSQADRAASDVRRQWRNTPGGEGLLARHTGLGTSSAELPDRVDRMIRDWQSDLLDLIRSEGQDRRTTARVMAYGVNALSVVLMLVVFTQTGGLTGAEGGIAAGSAILAQRILEAVFGDQAVRDLARKARRNLMERVQELYDDEEARYVSAVDEVAVSSSQAAELAQAAVHVRSAR
ncbi:dynamin family protein [Arsenicicoccus dermatophilus]|nr:dynamin family protein [Arsenicicoccus dermatophilus]MCH8613417.1 dynamin family protein [Arsenicicoccus dermatophilus]